MSEQQSNAAGQASSKDFVISRTVDAPLDKVWKAWTDRDELLKWFGPKGFTMEVATLDFRPGGVFHYCLVTPDGFKMWGKFVYREIVPQKKIALINSFSDENGGLTRHPMSATWPLEMLSTSEFTEENGKTTLTLHWSPWNPSDEEQKTFDTAHDGMRQGWTGTFEQLDEYLKTA